MKKSKYKLSREFDWDINKAKSIVIKIDDIPEKELSTALFPKNVQAVYYKKGEYYNIVIKHNVDNIEEYQLNSSYSDSKITFRLEKKKTE